MEALYLLSLAGTEWEARTNMRLRHPPVEAIEALRKAAEALRQLDALHAQGAVVWDKTGDTQEACRG